MTTQTTHRLTADPDVAARYLQVMKEHRQLSPAELVKPLAETATAVRRDILATIQRAQLGHVGGDLSVTDILVSVYWGVLNVDPLDPDAPGRDRFVLSKGHCAAALYSVLASCGFFPRAELESFAQPLSPLNGHPNRVKVPGVET